MPRLTFLSAQHLPSNQAGTAYVFLYTIDASTVPHRIHVVGGKSGQYFTDEDQHEYSQKLFSGALFVINQLWANKQQLPDEQYEYHHTVDFPTEALKAIPWEGYQEVLEDYQKGL